MGTMISSDLREARLTPKEKTALQRSLRNSKKLPPKLNLKNIPARDQAQTPPYALLPLLPYIPRDFIVWESAASKYGFLGEAIRALRGNTVIETGLELDGTDYLTTASKGDMEITNPPFSLKYEWLARAYENRKPFALLMPFSTWEAATAQALFQKHGVSVIIFNRRVNFHMPNLGWGHYDEKGEPIMTWDEKKKKWVHKVSSSDYGVAWFTWGLGIKTEVVYGYVPLARDLPTWMTRPAHRGEITRGALNVQDKLAIKHAINPIQWPIPNTKGGARKEVR